ncbi:hypothetical protein BDR03DRAFT_412126 [Suillus americanus]|nr:hypothetical protein BDR03DRAFT_412126 [Suillus americanus]
MQTNFARLRSISSDVHTNFECFQLNGPEVLAGSLSDPNRSISILPPGHLSELEDVIEFHRATLVLCPPHHSLQFNYINNLVVSLCDIFRQQGALSDLDEAIELYRAALTLRLPGRSCLNNLATSLRTGCAECSTLSDLDEGGH